MEYNFRISTDVSVDYAVNNLRKYTFPDIYKKNSLKAIKGPLSAVTVHKGKEFIGLSLIELNNINKTAEIISLAVSKENRNKGIGSQLMDNSEKLIQKSSCKTLYLRYQSNWGSFDILNRLLNQKKWGKPKKEYLICNANYKSFLDLLTKYDHLQLPEGYSMFLWGNLTLKEKQSFLKERENKGIYPKEYYPFLNEHKIEYLNSLGLRFKNKIVGWFISYRLDQDTIEYNNHFIDPEHRKNNVASIFIRDALQIQHKAGIPNGTWIVNYKNRPMIHITNSLRDRTSSKVTAYLSIKEL